MFEHLKSIYRIDKRIALGALAIMLAALLWSLDGIFIRPKFYTLPAPLVVFLEHLFGFIILCPFIILSWSKIKLLRLRDWAAIIWVCFFGGLLGTIMITQAFFAAIGGEITFATVVILQKLQPVFALLLARLILGEKLKSKFYLWAVIAIIAVYFLSFGSTGINPGQINLFHHAAFYAILAAFAFGSSTVFGKRIVNHLDFKSTAALRFGITSLMAASWILLSRDFLKLGLVSSLQWGYLILIVFSSGAVAMFIYYFGLKRVSASLATICELFWPLSAVLLDYLINKNILSNLQILASLVLLFAILKIINQSEVKDFKFSAGVITGAGRGEGLGFPTINLDQTDLDFEYGVYLVRAEIEDRVYQGLLHFGPKETFSEKPSLELFIKENIKSTTNKIINIKILKKVREIKKFSGPDELKKQIGQDSKLLETKI